MEHVAAGGMSGFRHTHMREDEFIYVVEGELILLNADRPR